MKTAKEKIQKFTNKNEKCLRIINILIQNKRFKHIYKVYKIVPFLQKHALVTAVAPFIILIQFQWTELSISLLRGRMFHAAVAFHGDIWIAGGLLEKRLGDSFNDLCTRYVIITYTERLLFSLSSFDKTNILFDFFHCGLQ